MEHKLRDLLKASMNIVTHNFCQFLPSLLLLCYVMTVVVIPPTSFFPFTLFMIYASAYKKACQSNPSPNSIPNATPDPNPNFSSLHFDACRESTKLLICLFMGFIAGSETVERMAMALSMICGSFVIFWLLELMLGFVYVGFTLRSLATFCPIVEESGAGVQAMERWSFSLLLAWAWVAGFAMFLLAFLEPSVSFISLDSRIFTQLWNWSIACACVGLPALLFLYIRSTQVTLYLACKVNHKECKEALVTHTSECSSNN